MDAVVVVWEADLDVLPKAILRKTSNTLVDQAQRTKRLRTAVVEGFEGWGGGVEDGGEEFVRERVESGGYAGRSSESCGSGVNSFERAQRVSECRQRDEEERCKVLARGG